MLNLIGPTGKGDFMNVQGKASPVWRKVVVFMVLLNLIVLLAEGAAQETGTFKGTLNAMGEKKSIDFTENRSVFTFFLQGHVNLKDGVGNTADFWAQWVGLWDTETGGTARCVWKNENGAKIFLVIDGNQLEKGAHLEGTLVGGTGPFKGIEGNLSFTWTSLSLETGDHVIAGYAKNIEGSYRIP
jgi:hypothetical protein